MAHLLLGTSTQTDVMRRRGIPPLPEWKFDVYEGLDSHLPSLWGSPELGPVPGELAKHVGGWRCIFVRSEGVVIRALAKLPMRVSAYVIHCTIELVLCKGRVVSQVNHTKRCNDREPSTSPGLSVIKKPGNRRRRVKCQRKNGEPLDEGVRPPLTITSAKPRTA
jgi:hypothetical protein